MGNKATISPGEFVRRYDEFGKLYTQSEGPVIVHVYLENGIYKLYMPFNSVMYYTRMDPEAYRIYMTRFSILISLVEDMR